MEYPQKEPEIIQFIKEEAAVLEQEAKELNLIFGSIRRKVS